jgi:hypothetical protein
MISILYTIVPNQNKVPLGGEFQASPAVNDQARV